MRAQTKWISAAGAVAGALALALLLVEAAPKRRVSSSAFKNRYIYLGHYTEMVSSSIGVRQTAIVEGASHLNAPGDKPLYMLQAGGPYSVVGLTNWPSSNRVDLKVAEKAESEATFRLTNREQHSILLWNVRVQTPTPGPGTDGFGWKTVYDDYPNGRANYSPGAAGEFRVPVPDVRQWRACALYSIDWTDSGKSYFGNYEVLSQVVTNNSLSE